MSAGGNPLQAVTRWRGGHYTIDGGTGAGIRECGRAALRAGLQVTAAPGPDGVMVVTVATEPARRGILARVRPGVRMSGGGPLAGHPARMAPRRVSAPVGARGWLKLAEGHGP